MSMLQLRNCEDTACAYKQDNQIGYFTNLRSRASQSIVIPVTERVPTTASWMSDSKRRRIIANLRTEPCALAAALWMSTQ